MTQLGIQIIPTMPVDEVIEIAVMAEELGYDFCLLADEGFMPDVYVTLGVVAQRTQRIRLGPVTNGYTRHPAVTANAVATLDDLSGGRALAVLVAGGSMVLNPMGIPRDAPLTVMRETITVLRRLWRGEEVSWQGKRFTLQRAQLHSQRACDIPLWLAVRGEKMLELAGQEADGVVLVVKSDLRPALEIIAQAEAGREERCQRIYMDRIAYTPQLLEEASALYAYVLMDSPPRMLDGLGITCPSTHNPATSLSGDTLQRAVELNQILGSRTIVAASAPPKLVTADAWKAFADTCAKASETLRPLGMRAGFHNHASEWQLVEGQRPMDLLAAGTPRDFVLQFDIGTGVQAGQDPVAWINANPGRINSMHCKDWGAGDGRGYAVAFGEGDAPWLRIFQAAESTGGIEHYLLEQEVAGPIGEIAMVQKCLENYRRIRA